MILMAQRRKNSVLFAIETNSPISEVLFYTCRNNCISRELTRSTNKTPLLCTPIWDYRV